MQPLSDTPLWWKEGSCKCLVLERWVGKEVLIYVGKTSDGEQDIRLTTLDQLEKVDGHT